MLGQHGLHGFEELHFAVGFGQVASKTGGLQPFGLAGLGAGGEGDDRRGGTLRVGVLAQGAGGGFAVHARHLNVHQHQVERADGEQLDGRWAAGRRGYLPTPVAEHGFGQQAVHQVVFHQQHPPRRGRRWGIGRGIRLGSRRLRHGLKGQGEGKRTALAH